MRVQFKYEDYHCTIRDGKIRTLSPYPDIYIDGVPIPPKLLIGPHTKGFREALNIAVEEFRLTEPDITEDTVYMRLVNSAWEDWCRRHNRPTRFSLLPEKVQRALKSKVFITVIETCSAEYILSEYAYCAGTTDSSDEIFDVVKSILAIEEGIEEGKV